MVKIRVILLILSIGIQQYCKAQKTAIKDKTTYYLSSVFIGGQKNTKAKEMGHIVFDLAKKSATCFTSCNFIQLKYTQAGANLKFTTIEPGKESCPDRLAGLDADFKENLPKINTFSARGKQIIFLNTKDTLMIFYEAELPKK